MILHVADCKNKFSFLCLNFMNSDSMQPLSHKMKNKNYHTVGTVPKSNRKDAKRIPLTLKYMTAHFPGLVHEYR